jgi:hypothetical protein
MPKATRKTKTPSKPKPKPALKPGLLIGPVSALAKPTKRGRR